MDLFQYWQSHRVALALGTSLLINPPGQSTSARSIVTTVPEPTSMLLLGTGLMGAGGSNSPAVQSGKLRQQAFRDTSARAARKKHMYTKPMILPLDSNGRIYALLDEEGNTIGTGTREVCEVLMSIITKPLTPFLFGSTTNTDAAKAQGAGLL